MSLLPNKCAVVRALFVVCAFGALSSQMAFSAEKPVKPSKTLPFVAVIPITGTGIDASALQVVTDGLSDELIRTGKVRVMERSQMENILKEQGFQQSGACDGSECAVEMGKLLSIDKMVVGSLGKIGSSWSLSVRAVDVGSGEVVGTSRRMQRGDIDEVVSGLLPLVASELSASLNGGGLPVAVAQEKPVAAPVAKPVAPVASSGWAIEKAPKTVAPAPVSKPEPVAQDTNSGSRWGWWAAGGVVLAGGVAAAVLLSGSESSTSSPAASTSSTTNSTTNGPWSTTVEW